MPDRTRRTGDLVSENNIFVDIANDRVGIGTTVPEYDLDIGGLENSIDPQNAGFGTVRIASHLGIGHSDLTRVTAKPENTNYGAVLTLGGSWSDSKNAYIIFDTDTGSGTFGNVSIGNYDNLKNIASNSSSNVAIGAKNLYQATTVSDYNVAIGYENLGNLTSGSRWNIGIGYQSLIDVTSSSTYNIALGHRSGRQSTSTNIDDNIFIGRSAGDGILSSNSNDNIYIGRGAGVDGTSTQRERNIVIGNVPAVKVGDDQFAIGVDNGTSDNYWLVGDENFNVGIGTTNPTAAVGVGNTAVLAVGIVSAYQLYVNGSPVSGGSFELIDDTNPQLGGTLDTNGNLIQFGDSTSATDDRLQFGDAQDFQIYHDGSNSFIEDVGPGHLYIKGSDAIHLENAVGTQKYARFFQSGAAELYYSGSKKFETTGIGVSILNGTEDTATITGPSNLVIDPGTVGDNTGIVRIKGDLFVDGTQTQINSTTIELADFIVGIATTATSDLLADGAGIQIGPDNTFLYDHTNTSLKSSENLNLASGKTYKIDGTDVLSATTLGTDVINSSLTSVGTLGSLTVSGDISIADKIVHTDDTDTAIRFPAADTFTVDTAGSEKLRVDVNGNVGIGSTIPTQKLDVVGNIAVTGTVDGRNVATDGSKLDNIEANADVTDATNVDNAGAVMETDTSTANMSFVVDEDNMASDSATKVPTQQSVKAYVDANSGGGGSSYWVQTDVGIHTLSSVGIGTTNPQSKLEINVGTAVSAFDIQGSAGQLFSVTNNLTSGSIFSVNDVTGIPSIDVDADGTIQLAPFGSTEYVGIGTTNPTQKLDVNGNVAIGGSIYDANGTSGSDGQVLSNVTGFGVSWTDQSGGGGGASAINDLSDGVTNSSGRTIGLGTGALANDDGTTNDNTALGYKALNANSSGSAMTGIGHSALANAGEGSGNACTAVGYFALNVNTSGSDNTAVGYYALRSNISAQRSTAMGYQAVEGASTADYATGFGAYTLRDLTIGNNNTAIGAFAGDDITTGSNNTCVGYQATASSASVSNEITLGNINVTSLRIPGLQSGASDGDVLTYSSSSGNITLAAASGGSSYWVQTDVGIHTLSSVGIGTTNPEATLQVDVGTGTTAFDVLGSEGTLFSVTNNLTSGSIFSVNDVSGMPSIDVDADGTIQLAPSSTTENVGVGTTNPTSKLHVVGDTKVTGVVSATSYYGNGSNLTGVGDITSSLFA